MRRLKNFELNIICKTTNYKMRLVNSKRVESDTNFEAVASYHLGEHGLQTNWTNRFREIVCELKMNLVGEFHSYMIACIDCKLFSIFDANIIGLYGLVCGVFETIIAFSRRIYLSVSRPSCWCSCWCHRYLSLASGFNPFIPLCLIVSHF